MNIPHIFQGLGAIASAFGDPQTSLRMSQNVFSEIEALKARKQRQEEQTAALALRERQIQTQEAAQQLAMLQHAQAQQRRAESDAFLQATLQEMQPQTSPGYTMASGATMTPASLPPSPAIPAAPQGPPGDPYVRYAPVAAQSPFQQVPAPPPLEAGEAAQRLLVGGARFGDDRLTALGKVLQGPREAQVARWAANAPPEQVAAYMALKRAGAPTSNVYIDKDRGRPNSLRYDQQYGEAPKDTLYQRDAAGNLVMEPRYNEATQSTRPMPVLTPMEADTERSAEATKVAASVATGLRNIDAMEQISAELGDTWGLGTRSAFAANLPNTEGGKYRKLFEDTLDVLIRLRTGAAATESERIGMRAIYMPSFIAGQQTRDEQLNHLRNSIRAYEEFRTRMGYASDKPLTDEENEQVLAEIDAQRAEAGMGPGLRQTALPIPPSRATIPDHTFVGYDQANGLYLYVDEQGNMVQRRVTRQE